MSQGIEAIERYHLVRRIGSGAFGTVYLARDIFLEEDVAVKMPLRQRPDLLEFLREPRLLHRLNDPHVVALRDIEIIQGMLCLVMEYVGGGSLRDRMGAFGRGHALPQAFSVRAVRGVLGALRSAHSLGVLHRDIKPENVLLAEGGFAKVTDFGVARIVAETGGIDRTMQPGGPIVYMSPEALRGEISHESDLWATCAMLYEMLAGHPPFPGPSKGEVVTQIFDAKPCPLREINPGIDAGLAEIVHRALAERPADRFHDVDEIDRALEAVELHLASAPEATGGGEANTIDSPEPSASRIDFEGGSRLDVSIATASFEDLPRLVEHVRQLLQSHPSEPRFHRSLAVALRRMEKDGEAYEEYERAFLLDRTDPIAAEGLADLGPRLRRPHRTAEALLALVEIEPRSASYQRRLALALERNGERGRAIAHLRRSLALVPDQPRMWTLLKRWEEGKSGEE